MRAKTAIVLAVALLSALALATSASGTHPRVGGAVTLRAPMLPAFQDCATPNGFHVAPISSASCSPPVPESDIVTLGAVGQGQGSVKLTVFCYPPEMGVNCTANDGEEEADVRIESLASDLRCLRTVPRCSAAGADYTGRLITRSPMRITDHANPLLCSNAMGASPCATATVEDLVFDALAPAGACAPVTGARGSTCAYTTTMRAELPGAIWEFQRMQIMVLGLRVMDLGEDGDAGANCPLDCGTGDETRFLEQGLFAP